MEFFNKARAVRLRSHLNKYLVADEDEESVRQSRNGSSRKACWTVEFVEGKNHVIRLKSCHGRYLTPSDDPFLLGMTGKKVFQTLQATKKDSCLGWEPIKEGSLVKLRGKGGKFLRANWGPPPWRNSVTHDVPNSTATQDWVLWEVDTSIPDSDSLSSNVSPASSFSSSQDDFKGSNTWSPSIASDRSAYSRQRQDGMEFFDKAKAVRLKSHHGKYLVADEDEETVRQSRSGSSHKARWTVEFVEGKSNAIRLKSFHGLYLTATDEPFLLGMTGKKVLQYLPATNMDPAVEWEPIKEGSDRVKLRSSEGKFLRANWGTPPWRNSITHDIPHRTATQDWILWGVDVVDISISESESVTSCLSLASSFSSLADDFEGSPYTGSPLVVSGTSGESSAGQSSGMEFFQNAKSIRLRSHHDKYLLADDDRESVFQDRYGSSKNAKWTVELVEGIDNVVRLKSCYGKYLTATDEQYLLGVTGRKVVQIVPRKLDSSVEWEPIRDGVQVKLKTRYGNFLRANGGLPPWRNSVTHDIPHRHSDWILWEVDLVERRAESPKRVSRSDSVDSDLSSSSFQLTSTGFSKAQSSESFDGSPAKSDGRMIYYNVADDDGKVDAGIERTYFQFKGNGLEELTQKLEEETGLENIIVCSRNPLNGKLYPLRLALPPNNVTMHIVVLSSTSKAGRNFVPEIPTET